MSHSCCCDETGHICASNKFPQLVRPLLLDQERWHDVSSPKCLVFFNGEIDPLGTFFFLCHNTTDIRIKLIIKGTWKNGVIININCGIYINAKVVPIQYTKKVSSSTLHNQLRGKNYKSGKMLDCCCCISMALVEQLYNDQQQLCIDQLMNMKYGGII
jgi:hypothetical protein